MFKIFNTYIVYLRILYIYVYCIFVEEIYKMQNLEISCAVRPIYWPLGVKWLILISDDATLLT